MKKHDVEELIGKHYRRELERARHELEGLDPGEASRELPNRGAAPRLSRRGWLQYLAAAAALVTLPTLLLVSRAAVGPLARVIDQEWNNGGREAVENALLVARDALLIQPGGSGLTTENEEE